ncbi:MAG TPA: LLM class flavin-dependent oxidoreductase, partial [Thermomicrobiaceae bacterium]|nr:LLM class flavin-dependent oxidoreductase [Thermomicrobiaceae bacterium]
MRFGVVIDAQAPDGVRAFAARAEALGFDSLWASDHPLISGVGCFSALTLAAGTTRAVRLGTCVACVYYWNPVVLARAAADVDRVSGGRLVLGLGRGDHPREFAWLGLRFPPARERARALAEALRIVRPLLAGETVTVEGQQFRAEGA